MATFYMVNEKERIDVEIWNLDNNIDEACDLLSIGDYDHKWDEVLDYPIAINYTELTDFTEELNDFMEILKEEYPNTEFVLQIWKWNGKEWCKYR